MMSNIEITREMMEAVVMAQLYREDVIKAITKLVGKITNKDAEMLYKEILQHPDFSQIKEDLLKVEEATLIDENADTIMLYYNKLLKDAQFEKKYEVILRILKEIRQMKAIEDEQMQFEVTITVEEPKHTDE